MKKRLTGILVLLSISSFAGTFFSVNFDNDELESPPATGKFNKTITSSEPSSVKLTKEEKAIVVKPDGKMSGQVLKMVSKKNSSGLPLVVFDGGDDLVASGKVVLSWDCMISELTMPEGNKAETAFSMRVIGNKGELIMAISLTALSAKGGIVSFSSADSPAKKIKWTVGEPQQFKLVLDLDVKTYSLQINKANVASGLKLQGKSIPFRLLQFQDGWAIGGSSGSMTALIDNVVIKDGEE